MIDFVKQVEYLFRSCKKMQRWMESEAVSCKDQSDIKKWEFNVKEQMSKFEIWGSKIKFLVNTQGFKWSLK